MSLELNLRFPDPQHVIVRWGEVETPPLPFDMPLTARERKDLSWYLETYAASYTTNADDAEASHIAAQLPMWGQKLCNSVFSDSPVSGLFQQFLQRDETGRLLTISATHPAILGLPWELLHTPDPHGNYLLDENPRITIRRRIAGATNFRQPYHPGAKERLHLLFVVSRPSDEGFIDPRADASAVLDAIESYAPGRITVEFLRPATFEKLVLRLQNKKRPRVDILHFDGHGVFDISGALNKDKTRAGAMRWRGTTNTLLREGTAKNGTNTGYLLFEDKDGKSDFVSAEELGQQLNQSKIGLVVVSACQTAMVGSNDDAMGSVAARLTSTGIPSVLAMSHSVLVPTTKRLFGHFYEQLAQGCGVGEALELARNFLRVNPERREVQRGPVTYKLKLQDWCVPTLYQPGTDGPLLLPSTSEGQATEVAHSNLLPPTVPFCGRRGELWQIERWFVEGTQRVSISGFGGQGKTFLAQEVGRWLLRTEMFQRVVFLSFASYQGVDAYSYAVSAAGVALGETLVDAKALTASLRQTPTLLILDNLEDVPTDQMDALLNGAKEWSQAGESRVLTTARPTDLQHSAFALQNDPTHQHLSLGPLSPENALDLYSAVQHLPPAPVTPLESREALLNVFGQVSFHPLSIRLLSQQLKTRRAVDLRERLHELLLSDTGDEQHRSLLASLQLSLDRLSPQARDQWLPRLGVFQGGAMEASLLVVTGFGLVEERADIKWARRLLAALESGDWQVAARLILSAHLGREIPDSEEMTADVVEQVQGIAAQQVVSLRLQLGPFPSPAYAEGVDETTWPQLKAALLSATLMEVENLSDEVAFLKFHPTLAPALWAQLASQQRAELTLTHRQHYYSLSCQLYHADDKNPHAVRAVARRERSNLLRAARGALDAGDESAVDFVDNVNRFLNLFGLPQDAADLSQRAFGMEGDEKSWYLAQSGRGEQLLAMGDAVEATKVFDVVLERLGEEPSYNRCATLDRLGRCFEKQSQYQGAIQYYRQGLEGIDQLEQGEYVRTLRGTLQGDLADSLMMMGHYSEARKKYENALAIHNELENVRGKGVTNGQLGMLAMKEGNLSEAARRYNEALELFQQLGEPGKEATCWHQLGRVFQEARHWEEAEGCYREAARIKEAHGDLASAASTWNQIALVNQSAGKLEAAEGWHRKVLETRRQGNNAAELASTLNNLALLLQQQPNRLVEARQLAEESLVIKEREGRGETQIWTTYLILSWIAAQQGEVAQARQYQRQAREAFNKFPGNQQIIQRFEPYVAAVLASIAHPPQSGELEETLTGLEKRNYTSLSAAIRHVVEGERDGDVLCESLDLEDSLIINTILARIDEHKEPG